MASDYVSKLEAALAGKTRGPKGNQPGKNINIRAARKQGMSKSDVLMDRGMKNKAQAKEAFHAAWAVPNVNATEYSSNSTPAGRKIGKKIKREANELNLKSARQITRANELKKRGF